MERDDLIVNDSYSVNARHSEEDGKKIGFQYRSTQKSTDGIGDKIEYFNDAPDKKGEVVRERTYFARLNSKE